MAKVQPRLDSAYTFFDLLAPFPDGSVTTSNSSKVRALVMIAFLFRFSFFFLECSDATN